MKRLITTAFATLVAVYGYSQDGIHLPLTGGTISGSLIAPSLKAETSFPKIDLVGLQAAGRSYSLTSYILGVTNAGFAIRDNTANLNIFTIDGANNFNLAGPLTGTSATFSGNLRAPAAYSERHYDSDNNAYYIDGASTSMLNNINLTGTLTGTSATFNGNVGIGTKLNINGGNGQRIEISNSGMASDQDYGAVVWKNPGGTLLGNIALLGNPNSNSDGSARLSMGVRANTNATSLVEALTIQSSGNIGIGTLYPGSYKLAVAGNIRATEVKVEALPWPDYVFYSSYKLPDLKSTEQFIKENKHLPEIPSAAEVAKEGISLGEMNAKLLKKIEELTLHLIEQNHLNIQQNKRIDELEKQLKK